MNHDHNRQPAGCLFYFLRMTANSAFYSILKACIGSTEAARRAGK
jgi:hypothetical protein